MLSEAEINAFIADGFVAIRQALPAGIIKSCQDEIWAVIEATSEVRRDDPATWRDPVVRISCPESETFAAAGTQPVLWEAFDQLIGEGRCLSPVPGARRVVAACRPAPAAHRPARRPLVRCPPAGPAAQPGRGRDG